MKNFPISRFSIKIIFALKMIYDEFYIKRCFELAKNGLGNVSPNPLVGCVIVSDNKIISEGYHQIFGGLHAEPNAISRVKNQDFFSESTLYVNLEPCSHYGKTPPCAELIIEKGIKNVVISNLDPNPLVAGNGVKKLQEAGINVKAGILEREGWELNRRFFTFMTKKRPYIILKWAQTLDGFMDIERENASIRNYWITNKHLKTLVHKWRSEEDAIMIGTNTAKNDNPALTTREWIGKNPVRIVIDKSLNLNKGLKVFNVESKTFIYNIKQDLVKDNISYIKIDSSNILQDILSDLYQKGIQSVIIEGGENLLSSFISQNLWDEARILIGNKLFIKGLKAPLLPLQPENITSIDEDKILFYRNNS